MSTPEMPPQTPTTPAASDADTASAAQNAHPSEPATNGKPTEAEAAGDDRSDASEGAAVDAQPEDATPEGEGGGAPAAGTGDKKRRRRRRKKKPGGQQVGTEASPPDQPEPAVDGEASPEAPVEAGAGTDRQRQDKRDGARKEKKHGPPRERPPVTMGDIVFGKIIEITDEAIFVDIPGKARAVFDRREMLLPEDDERDAAAASSRAAAQASAATPPPADRVGEGASEPSPAAEAAHGAEQTPPDGPDGQPASAHDAPGEDAAHEPSPPAEPIEVAAAPAEPAPREPKVPRVILEVGADFIAVVHNDGARGGLVVLTHHPNRSEKIKPALEKALQDKSTVLALVTGAIKGGIELDVDGLRAFAPGSHVDLRMGADLSYLVGKRLPFFVTQYAKRGRDVVLSRKTIIEDEARKARADALASLKVGEDLEGVVRSVVPFGAFVDVGGIEGLVPLQEMSHNRADGPSDVFKAGEPTRVRVIKIDDRGKVWLSRKATIPDPWQQVAQKYAHGTRHSGKVVRLQPFGAFIELEPGVDGLIHTQDLSIKRIELPGEVVKVGDPIDVVVAHLDPTQHKIGLHPSPQGDVANEAPQRVAPHKAVKARVVAIESGGLVVRILGVTGRNARGYVTSAGTGTPRGTELRKAFSVGQDVEAKVVEVDPRRGEVKLSIKALSEDQERNAYQQYRQQLKAEARFTLADLLTKKSPR